MPTFKEAMELTSCKQLCNTDCLMTSSFLTQNKCLSDCACKCNTVCLEACEGLDDDSTCKMGCGCTVTSAEIIAKRTKKAADTAAGTVAISAGTVVTSVAKAADTASTTVAKAANTASTTVAKAADTASTSVAKAADNAATTVASIAAATSTSAAKTVAPAVEAVKCAKDCTSPCLTLAITKDDTVKCFVDCECFPATAALEITQATEVKPIASGSSGALGYIFFALFLSAVVGITAYFVIERDGKKKYQKTGDIQDYRQNMLYEKIV